MSKETKNTVLIWFLLAVLLVLAVVVITSTGKHSTASVPAAYSFETQNASPTFAAVPADTGMTVPTSLPESTIAPTDLPALATSLPDFAEATNLPDFGDPANLPDFAEATTLPDFGSDTQSAPVTDEKAAARRPEASSGDGFLPVFRKANTEEKVIAITVDDMAESSNLRAIVDVAVENGSRFTLFPIGKYVVRNPDTIRYAYENGIEIENHTMTHNGLYACDDETLMWEIAAQNRAVCNALGVEYKSHFLRPKGGDARNDQRMHVAVGQLGYYGVAHWCYSGTANEIADIKDNLKPGYVYLFHCQDKDLEKLREFIPYAVGQGYRLVTLNEMFGYPANETSTLTETIAPEDVSTPKLRDYKYENTTLKKGTYTYAVTRVQARLIKLGYLDGTADGDYGNMTVAAVSAFQKRNDLEETGEVSPETYSALFSDNAKKAKN